MAVRCYQYVPLIKHKAITRLVSKIQAVDAHPVLDLEDSVQDTLHPENTPIRKEMARDGLRKIVASGAHRHWKDRVSVRINASMTSEFQRDLDLLSELSEEFELYSIWLPMVEKIDQIRDIEHCLRDRGVAFSTIVPIIETVAGVRSLDEMLENAAGTSLSLVHYGHYDFSFDAGHWPFLRQDEAAFWDHVSAVIRTVEQHGFTYVHTPVGELQRDDLFCMIEDKLGQVCSAPFARAALNFQQSKLLHDGLREKWVSRDRTCDLAGKIAQAKNTIDAFLSNQIRGRSFSVKSGIFITPHEYRAALKFLDDCGAQAG